MKTVTIKKQQLMTAIFNNCQKHKNEYIEAVETYKKAVVQYYKDLAAKMEKDPWANANYDPPERPRSYVKNYEEAYDMLGYEVNEILTITVDEFKSYVKDEWSWKNSFETMLDKNAKYINR